MATSPSFTTIPQSPVSTPLDSRSRPADLAPGSFRYRLNFAVNRTGSLCMRAGHSQLSFALPEDFGSGLPNFDHHRQGAARELPTLLFESTGPDGVRRLFDGTSSRVSWLNSGTSEWIDIFTTGAAGGRFKMAELVDKVAFTNNIDPPRVHTLGSGTSAVLTELVTELTAQGLPARVRLLMAFGQVMVAMVGDLVIWSDFKNAEAWTPDDPLNPPVPPTPERVCGFQQLDAGDEILAAAIMGNALYIFTERAIWRCVVNVTDTTIFAFYKIYSEPKNQTACISYPNTLVSTGKELYWWGRNTIWMLSPFIIGPESPDWLLKACGAQFSTDNPDRLDLRCCESPVGDYRPDEKELWFSYPIASTADEPACVNNRCLVVNHEFKTADLVDIGYGALVNFRQTPETDQNCNATRVFIGSSGTDYTLKAIGGVFYRENVTLVAGEVATDIPDASYAVTQAGYYRRLVGHCPFGYPDKQKTLNSLEIEHDTVPQAIPNLLTLRIGNSHRLADPMSLDAFCAVQWHDQPSIQLTCPDAVTLAAMAADGMKPSDPTGWTLQEQNLHLYFDIRLVGPSGEAPKGSDSAWSGLSWSVMTD